MIENFVKELRRLGVKRIELDLGDTDQALLDDAMLKIADTEPPAAVKDSGLCAVPDCSNPNRSSTGHSRMGPDLCDVHYRQQMGIT